MGLWRCGLCLLMAALLAAGISGCPGKKEMRIAGRTMGTTYHIRVVAGWFAQRRGLAAKIERRLEDINAKMSTYLSDSEISRFNHSARPGQKFSISEDFHEVMQTAAELYRISEGAWDATVMPLVSMWGFDRSAAGRRGLPAPEKIDEARRNVGFHRITVGSSPYLVKQTDGVRLDLASVAKGFGVDAVAEVLRREGYRSFLVEIGGEVFAAGLRRDGRQWKVGINRPHQAADRDDLYQIVALSNRALATSGDYRQFFEAGGRRYSHVIDPRTGFPVQNGVVSVSVVADNCTAADGLATALMVMGVPKGLALVERLQNVECLIVCRDSHGCLQDHASDGFRCFAPSG